MPSLQAHTNNPNRTEAAATAVDLVSTAPCKLAKANLRCNGCRAAALTPVPLMSRYIRSAEDSSMSTTLLGVIAVCASCQYVICSLQQIRLCACLRYVVSVTKTSIVIATVCTGNTALPKCIVAAAKSLPHKLLTHSCLLHEVLQGCISVHTMFAMYLGQCNCCSWLSATPLVMLQACKRFPYVKASTTTSPQLVLSIFRTFRCLSLDNGSAASSPICCRPDRSSA